jgi:hypothetical protein
MGTEIFNAAIDKKFLIGYDESKKLFGALSGELFFLPHV